MATAVSYKVPPVFTTNKPYSRWVDEIKAWQALTDLDAKKRGIAIALSLPEDGKNSIRDKVFSELTVDVLNADDGVEKLILFMDKIFKKDELSEAYEAYTDFDRFRRSKVTSMEDYVTEFEKLYNKTRKFKMDLPQPVLAFKLLEYSELEMKDRQLILTGVDYTKVDTLFTQMCTSLKKFFGQQAASGNEMVDTSGIKVESACLTSEDVNYARNRWGRNTGYRGNRGGYNGRDNGGRGNFTSRTGSGSNYKGNDNWERGNFGTKGRGSFTGKTTATSSVNKPINPDGPDGQPLRCLSCDSVRHLMKQCPHSYENLTKPNVENGVLFTGNKPQETLILLAESAYSAVLDSACTSTVAGEAWINCYMDSLDPSIRDKVVEQSSDTLFKFGGGTVLQSTKKVIFPCMIAGTECEIQADVVSSDIPLLLSKDSMKRAKMKLDLENDSASIFGKDVQLQCTSSGHYCVPIDQINVSVDATASALIATCQQKEKAEIIEKLHKQFAHPTAMRLKSLLKDAGGYTKDHLDYVDRVTDNCEVCKRFKKTPARPVVSLPLATEFNEVVAIDLKEWKPNVYFLHLVDVATRFSLAAVVRKKTPEVITEKYNQYKIIFPCLENIEGMELLLFTDASYANLSDRFSSAGGYVIFLKGKNGSLCPISWGAKKIKRVVKSTLAAEALSLVEGLDACYFVRSILHEMYNVKAGQNIMIKCYTDNKSLCQNIHSTKLISEKRLRMDLASIKESVSAGDISVTWVQTSNQISDCLTKAGADFHRLIEVLKTGKGLG